MLMTMTGLAATLDTIAEAPGVEEARSSGLHKVLITLGDVDDGSEARPSVDFCPGGDISATGGVGDGAAAGQCPHHVQVRGHTCPLGTPSHHGGMAHFQNCFVRKSEKKSWEVVTANVACAAACVWRG